MFAVLLGDKWMPTVPYFEAVCLAGLFYPVAMVAYNVMKVRCGGALIVRLEVSKKIVLTAIFALTIPRSVQAVVWGLVVFAACEMVVNVWAALRVSALPARRFVRTLFPIACVAGAMYAAVRGVAGAPVANPWLRLLLEVVCGAVVYLLLSLLFRLEAFRELRDIVRKQFAAPPHEI